MEKLELMKALVEELNRASAAYYGGSDEIMSNIEWDAKFDELKKLEAETGTVLPESPTNTVGQAVNDPRREPHEYPALSLDKSKDIAVIRKWAGLNDIWVSFKCDGLTLVATYDSEDGQKASLTKLLTRGNGIIGKNITELAPYIRNLPLEVPYGGHLVVRGEAMISYPDFERINATLEGDDEYANPRNLAAGTLTLEGDRISEVADRCVFLTAFNAVHFDEEDAVTINGRTFDLTSFGSRLDALDEMGFVSVDRSKGTYLEIDHLIEEYTEKAKTIDYPVDGLVITYDSYALSQEGSITGHHATNSGIAFKWADTEKETELLDIEWSCGTSCITPVAIFKPVELEGTTVKRATLHNISNCRKLGIGKGAKIRAAKMNLIIPAVTAVTEAGEELSIPSVCPVCGAPTEISVSPKNGTEVLHCTNDDCPAKQIRKFARFASKDGFDLDGLSEKTFAALINAGFIKEFGDLWNLPEHKAEIIAMEGFGEKSFNQMVSAITKRTKIHPVNFIYSLSIPIWGRDATKRTVKQIGSKEFFHRLLNGIGFEDIENIGPEKTAAVLKWWGDKSNRRMVSRLLDHVQVERIEPDTAGGRKCEGLVFVITGAVTIFKNRDEFKAYVESQGGKVAGSVSAKTTALVTNDTTSGTVKNKMAAELGVAIITEAQFVEQYGSN